MSMPEYITITLKLESPEWIFEGPASRVASELLGGPNGETVLTTGPARYEIVAAEELDEPPRFWAVAYSMDRAYGGPEEGGWWYDVGELVEAKEFDSWFDATAQAESWRNDKWKYTGTRSSVLHGGDDHDCWVTTEEPAEFFPQNRPYYE